MIETTLIWLVLTGLAAFVLASTFAPLETLLWWARQSKSVRRSVLEPAVDGPSSPVAAARVGRTPRDFIVYLGGIDRIGVDTESGREKRFLAALREGAPAAVLVDTVFPYAVSGNPLLQGPRAFDWMWQALDAGSPALRRRLLSKLVNSRNFFQVLVSADRRYGPVFNWAIASLIETSLRAAGWQPGSDARLILIGLSGGAQMAAGAASRLADVFDGPIQLISIGGIIASTPGIDRLARLDHLVGTADRVEPVGAIAFPARWPISVGSEWAEARRSGRLNRISLDGVHHTGANGYLGEDRHGGRQPWEETVAIVLDCIARGDEPVTTPAVKTAPSSHAGRPGGSDGQR